ncbi:MAG TPA: DNA polymerase IV [candidate division Zixibacteria bacterium]|nr:DNA polymerase IV [candidate division Zixibacteria bacterium]
MGGVKEINDGTRGRVPSTISDGTRGRAPSTSEGVWGNYPVIMHLDMDAFFAAIEQSIQPSLKGKPVIVGGDPDSRGVVSTCSYEARNYGIHSAMPMKEAHRLCPDAVFVNTTGDKYSYMSAQVVIIMKRFSPAVEPVSIDEAFCDITAIHKRYGGPEKTAQAIKQAIKEELNLTCSIGIGPNRSVAKIASGSNKPDGLVIVPHDSVKQFLWVRPVDHIWGVGKKSAEALGKVGIKTIGDLAKTPEKTLKAMFGIMGLGLVRMANGEGETDVRASHVEYEAKSMGHEHTFDKDTNDRERVLGLLLYLADRVSRRLRQTGCVGRTVTLKVRKSNFKLITRAITLSANIDTEKEIFRAARKLLIDNRFLDEPIRLIGVNISHLKKSESERLDDFLIDYDPTKKRRELDKVMDGLRDKHGEEAIFFASSQIF